MQSELNDYIDTATAAGSTPCDQFVGDFLRATGRLLSHENRLEVRYWLDQLGLLVLNTPPPSEDIRVIGGGLNGVARSSLIPGQPVSAYGGQVLRALR